MTTPMPDIFSQRTRDCGQALYKLKGIDRRNSAQKNTHFRENDTPF